MASKNVETLRAAHESWNKRDFAGVVKNAAEGLVYTDNARAVTLNGQDKFRKWTVEWAKAFSDGRITNPEYIGDIVIARFTVVGTNDGPFGSMKPPGRKMYRFLVADVLRTIDDVDDFPQSTNSVLAKQNMPDHFFEGAFLRIPIAPDLNQNLVVRHRTSFRPGAVFSSTPQLLRDC